jgi:hypothetical protein
MVAYWRHDFRGTATTKLLTLRWESAIAMSFGRHRFECGDATPLDHIEAQSATNEIEIFDNVSPAIDALCDYTGKGFSKKPRTMKQETQPIKEDFHQS